MYKGSHVPILNLRILRWYALPLVALDEELEESLFTGCLDGTHQSRIKSQTKPVHIHSQPHLAIGSCLVSTEASDAYFVASP